MDELGNALEFEIETDPSAEKYWWACLHFRGTCAIGSGDTPWKAIAHCLTVGVPQAIEFSKNMNAFMDKARAGTAQCPGCGAVRPKLENQTMWAFYCLACRGPETGDDP